MNSASTSSPFSLDVNDVENFFQSIELRVRNSLCGFNLPLHIDLRRVALTSMDVDLDRSRGVLLKQLRRPYCFAKIYSSGRIIVAACRSEAECKQASRKIGRLIQRSMGKLSEKIYIRNFKIYNIFATCRMPFGIRIEELAKAYRKQARFEPEVTSGIVWTSEEPKAVLRIHTTGSITVSGVTSEEGLKICIRNIYPMLQQYSSQSRYGSTVLAQAKRLRKRAAQNYDESLTENISARRPRRIKYHQHSEEHGDVYFSDEDDLTEHLNDSEWELDDEAD